MNLQKMMKQAQEMQSKMAQVQARAEALEMEGSAGGGAVTVKLSGKNRLLAVSIDAAALSDKETLEDLIVAAHNNAKDKIDEAAASEMGALTSGLNLPPGFKLPF